MNFWSIGTVLRSYWQYMRKPLVLYPCQLLVCSGFWSLSHSNGYVRCLLAILTCHPWLIKRFVILCAHLSCVSVNFLVAVIKNVTRSNFTSALSNSRAFQVLSLDKKLWGLLGNRSGRAEVWGETVRLQTHSQHQWALQIMPGWPSTDSRSLTPLAQRKKYLSDWRDGSVVKDIYCSCRRMGFCSWHPQNNHNNL